jgi:hypothetical protein
MSLPKQTLYTNRVHASHARNYQSNIAPQNGQEYSLGETIIINVPTASNIVMSGADTLLKCSLNVRNGTAGAGVACLDRGGIAGIIQRLRIFHGSTLLTDIDNYGNLVAMLTSLQQSGETCTNKLEVLQGLAYQQGVSLSAAATTDVSIDFSFSLLSILSLTSNYVPLFAMTGAPLRLEIQLVSSIPKFMVSNVVYTNQANTKLLTKVELICNMMEISESGMDMVRKAAGPVVQWVVSDYKNYANNAVLGTSETQVSVSIPAKFNSLKSLFWSFRLNSSGVAARYPHESCKFGMTEYTTRIGSQVIPAKAPNSVPEFFSELVRGIGSVGDTNHQTCIDSESYGADVPVAFAALANKSRSFYTGLDVESYSNTDMGSVYSGLNTSTHDIFYMPKFAAQAADLNVRIDTYALFDSLILFEDGVAMVTY